MVSKQLVYPSASKEIGISKCCVPVCVRACVTASF